MKVEIDVDLGPWFDGWELVAYRGVKAGEHVIFGDKIEVWPCDSTHPLPIVRKKWQWPEWLKAEWIAMDKNGKWFAHECEPYETFRDWNNKGAIYTLSTSLLAFTPPPCDDWRQSKRRKPHAKTA